MASSVDTDFSGLVQTAQPARRVQILVESLVAYVDTESIPAVDGYSKVECMHDETEVLDKIREEFKREPARSKKVCQCPFDVGIR